MSDEATSEKAARYGVEAAPLSTYSLRPLLRDGLVLGYTSINAEQITRGVRRLARALA